jgi:hypothetical protein
MWDALPDIIGSLSTSGAQWFKLVNSPSSVSVPAFAPTSQNAYQAQVAQQGIASGTNLLFIGALILGAVLIFRR